MSEASLYPYDNRFYFKLNQPTEEQILFFDLSKAFNKKFNHLIIRLQLYVANKYDCTKQLFGKLRHPNDTSTVPFKGRVPEESHLFIDIPAVIFGGHNGMKVSSRGNVKNGVSAGKVLVDQILRVDIGDTEIYSEETGTTEDISIRNNTYLTGLFKPGSGIVNLDPVSVEK